METFEGTKGVIRSWNSKDMQWQQEKDNKTNNDLQNKT